MALTNKQKALIDSCPVLKGLKSELIAVLDGTGSEEESGTGTEQGTGGSSSEQGTGTEQGTGGSSSEQGTGGSP